MLFDLRWWRQATPRSQKLTARKVFNWKHEPVFTTAYSKECKIHTQNLFLAVPPYRSYRARLLFYKINWFPKINAILRDNFRAFFFNVAVRVKYNENKYRNRMSVQKVESSALCKINSQDPVLELDHEKCLKTFQDLNFKYTLFRIYIVFNYRLLIMIWEENRLRLKFTLQRKLHF